MNFFNAQLESEVTTYLGQMFLLYLNVPDAPSKDSHRGVIERNSIALLSNFGKHSLDAASTSWLGRYSDRADVRNSGLWNVKHVREDYDPEFLELLAQHI